MQREHEAKSKRQAAIKRARRHVVRHTASTSQPPWQDALAVFLLTNANEEALAQYVARRPGKHGHVRRLVTDAYLAWPPEKLLSLEEHACSGHTAPLKRATKFVDEWKLAQWIRHHNSCHGVTPNVEAVWIQRQTTVAGSCEVAHTGGLPRPLRVRQWVRRFCRRWGGRRGLLQVHHGDQPQGARSKVMCSCFPFFFS